jgi:hypothetical protein
MTLHSKRKSGRVTSYVKRCRKKKQLRSTCCRIASTRVCSRSKQSESQATTSDDDDGISVRQCLVFQVVRHTLHVIRHTLHATRHTSHVTLHTSKVTRHKSHVTRVASHTRSPLFPLQNLQRSCRRSLMQNTEPGERCGGSTVSPKRKLEEMRAEPSV